MVDTGTINSWQNGRVTEVMLARHGETFANARHFYDVTGIEPVAEHVNPHGGRNVDDLNSIGVAQSRVLADAITGPNIHEMWCSPARRARATMAELIAQLQVTSATIQTVDELEEMQVSADEYAFMASGSMDIAPHELQARVTRFQQGLLLVRQRVANLEIGTRVLVVAHGGTNAGLLAGWGALPDQRWPTLANGSLSRLCFDQRGQLLSAAWNQIDHQPASLRRHWNRTENDIAANEPLI